MSQQDKPAWMITRDFLDPHGLEVGRFADQTGLVCRRLDRLDSKARSKYDNDTDYQTFRIKDDDGVPYYEGRMLRTWAQGDERRAFAPLNDFATPNDGATTLEMWNEFTKQWEQV